MDEGQGVASGEISDVGVLDLTGMGSTEELAGIEVIRRVGVVLVVAGQLLITTPVERVGYAGMIVAGQVYAPEGSEGALTAGITRLTGQVFYYSGKPRFFVGEDRFGQGFFEALDGPLSLILVGNFAIERGVVAELLKEKVAQILLAGNLRAPEELLPLVQVLAVEKAGTISALEEGE